MRTISVINYKGGVGKTTVAANVAAELAWRDYSVLLIDMDPQCSLTFSFVRPEKWQEDLSSKQTIKRWFDAFSDGDSIDLSDLIITPDVDGRLAEKGKLDLIASHLGLINVDLELATELGGATLAQSKRNYLRVHRRLLEGLAGLGSEAYDLVLIDCPPNFNVVTKNAIVASRGIVIPAKPDYLATLGIDYLIRSLNQLVSDYNEFADLDSDVTEKITPDLLGVLFTMVQFYGEQPISTMRPFIRQTKELGVPVFESMIRENKTLFGDAPEYGVPVVLTRQNQPTYQRVVDELEEVVTEFESVVGLTQ